MLFWVKDRYFFIKRLAMQNTAQDILNKLDQTKKSNTAIDELWHEIEAFGALAGMYSFGEATLDQVLHAAHDRINELQKSHSKALNNFEPVVADKVHIISLIDMLLCNVANIKDVFEDHIKKGEMHEDKRKIVELQLECIKKINEMLRQAGLKQHLSDEDIAVHYKGVIGAIGMQTVQYKESTQK